MDMTSSRFRVLVSLIRILVVIYLARSKTVRLVFKWVMPLEFREWVLRMKAPPGGDIYVE